MSLNIKPLFSYSGMKPKAAVFMSGSGSNAEKLLEAGKDNLSWSPAVVVTDRPKSSRAADIAKKFNLPLVGLDIKEFYSQHGESRVSLVSEKCRQIREQWTCELRKLIKPFEVDFGILAGFIPLSNITSDFPCLNIHPGDLLYEKHHKRYLTGLHKIPVERAILEEIGYMRSSVIIAQDYSGKGEGMDSGPILGVSCPVKIDMCGYSLKELKMAEELRLSRRPLGGFKDILDMVAAVNLEKLKCSGDWVVFPRAVDAFASGKYGYDASGGLFYKDQDGEWQPVVTVEFAEREENLIL